MQKNITHTDVKRILEKLEENTRTEFIKIRTRVDKQTHITKSKFGGVPYWPDIKTYPRTPDGTMLTLLAQINLSDLPDNDAFPDKGLLQFFILNAEDANRYKVILHKEIDNSVNLSDIAWPVPSSLIPESVIFTSNSGQQIEAVNPYWGTAGFPIQGELALEFSKEYESANLTEDCFHKEFKKAADQLNVPLPEDFDNVYDIDFLNEEDEKSPLNKYYIDSGHKLFGHPYFIHGDYRDNNDEVLLLQIDSAKNTEIFGETDENNFIEIGDVGIMRFFIKKDNLRKLDFSNADYEWESC